MAACFTCETRVWIARWVFTFLGAITGLLFAAQGVFVFVFTAVGYDDVPKDFWIGCRWVANGLLCLVLGLTIFLYEMKSCRTRVKAHAGRFWMNRVGLALVYLWAGMYVAGGAFQQGPDWAKTLGKVTGVLAWVVCLAHLLLAGCADHGYDERYEHNERRHEHKSSPKSKKAHTKQHGDHDEERGHPAKSSREERAHVATSPSGGDAETFE